VLGSFGAILIFDWLEKYYVIHFLEYFGKNSLILMAVQRALLINIAQKGWAHTIRLADHVCARWYLETLMILALVLLMTYGITEIINNNPKIKKFFLGR
jgi:hypothetical protein